VHQNVHLSVEQLTEMVEVLKEEMQQLKKYATTMEGKLLSMGVDISALNPAGTG
jgi:hypothetical protein